MAIFKKNIWIVYYLLITLGLFFTGIISYNTWHINIRTSLDRQKHVVSLISGALHGQLVSQEMVLNILNEELIPTIESNINKSDRDVTVLEIFNKLLSHDPSIAGLGVIDVSGNFIHISSNADLTKLPNLRKLEDSRHSFIHTINNKHKMVLGRTYFFKPINSWVIPIRKAMVNKHGRVIAVTATGFSLKDTFDIFSNEMHTDDNNDVFVIRDFDKYVQYVSTNKHDIADLYKFPVQLFKPTDEALIKKYSISLSDARKSGKIYSVNIKDSDGKEYQNVLKYDDKYEIWTVSSTLYRSIVAKFYKRFGLYLLTFSVVSGILFLMFKNIADAEKRRRDALKYQANHDTLTKLPNRNFFNDNLNKWIYPDAKPFAVYYIDMDNFKNINDSFGHHFGDLVLQNLANRLQQFSNDNRLVMRQGGDEFLLIDYNTADISILTLASELIEKVTTPYTINNLRFVLGASIGIAKYPDHGTDFDTLLSSADIAMYEAKKNRNKALIFDSKMKEPYLKKILMEQELRKAFDMQEFHMVFQPQLNHNSQVYGMESLVRWNSPSLGNVPPSEFIPVAESTGLILRIGDFIVDQSLKSLKEIQDSTGKELVISINISVSQLLELGFFENLMHKIANYKLNKSNVKLEITESLFIEDLEQIRPILTKMSENGLRISLDDFGTGFSSLNLLRKLPIDELKIDKSFVDDIDTDESSLNMVQNIIDIGLNLSMSVIAEGVETAQQKDLLYNYGCTNYQGYYFAKPMSQNDIIKFITKS